MYLSRFHTRKCCGCIDLKTGAETCIFRTWFAQSIPL